MIYITIRKLQGENRQKDKLGKLEATQHALYNAVICNSEKHPRFQGRSKLSIAAAKRDAEEIFGPLEWSGYPDYLGFENVHAAAQIKGGNI